MAQLLLAEEVSTIMRVSRQRVYELIRRKLLPCVRIGRQVRVSQAALDTFMESGGRGLSEDS